MNGREHPTHKPVEATGGGKALEKLRAVATAALAGKVAAPEWFQMPIDTFFFPLAVQIF